MPVSLAQPRRRRRCREEGGARVSVSSSCRRWHGVGGSGPVEREPREGKRRGGGGRRSRRCCRSGRRRRRRTVTKPKPRRDGGRDPREEARRSCRLSAGRPPDTARPPPKGPEGGPRCPLVGARAAAAAVVRAGIEEALVVLGNGSEAPRGRGEGVNLSQVRGRRYGMGGQGRRCCVPGAEACLGEGRRGSKVRAFVSNRLASLFSDSLSRALSLHLFRLYGTGEMSRQRSEPVSIDGRHPRASSSARRKEK